MFSSVSLHVDGQTILVWFNVNVLWVSIVLYKATQQVHFFQLYYVFNSNGLSLQFATWAHLGLKRIFVILTLVSRNNNHNLLIFAVDFNIIIKREKTYPKVLFSYLIVCWYQRDWLVSQQARTRRVVSKTYIQWSNWNLRGSR